MTGSPSGFNVSVAGVALRLVFPQGSAYERLQNQYKAFLTNQPPSFTMKVELADYVQDISSIVIKGDQVQQQIDLSGPGWTGRMDWEEKVGWFVIRPASVHRELEMMVRLVIAYAAYQWGGFLLHAAGVLSQGKVYCFLGPSGSGKTTVAGYSPDCQVLNDDLVLCIPIGGEWQVFSTPFTNHDQHPPSPGNGKITAFYRLVKSEVVTKEQLPPAFALAEVFANIPVLSSYPGFAQVLLGRCVDVTSQVPVYRLQFRHEPSFWKIVK